MRAAAFIAGAVIAVGIHLAVAAALEFSPIWIGLGTVAIGVVGAAGIVMAGAEPSRAGVPSPLQES
ncbi:MAG: hypothetical protein ACXWWU_07015 [Candidatus Limnocylindria bacterium]